jgi:nicotinate-nucleotide adenylyltransferase
MLTIELERDGPSYSVDSLERLSAERPGQEFVFIVSVEAARQMPTWHDPQRLLELTEVAVVPRLGYAPLEAGWADHAFPGQRDRFLFVSSSPVGHSASDVRARVAAGLSIRYLVPPPVEDYITRYRLYR